LRPTGRRESGRVIPLQMLLTCVLGWLEAEQRDVIAFRLEENRVLEGATGPPSAPHGR